MPIRRPSSIRRGSSGRPNASRRGATVARVPTEPMGPRGSSGRPQGVAQPRGSSGRPPAAMPRRGATVVERPIGRGAMPISEARRVAPQNVPARPGAGYQPAVWDARAAAQQRAMRAQARPPQKKGLMSRLFGR